MSVNFVSTSYSKIDAPVTPWLNLIAECISTAFVKVYKIVKFKYVSFIKYLIWSIYTYCSDVDLLNCPYWNNTDK